LAHPLHTLTTLAELHAAGSSVSAGSQLHAQQRLPEPNGTAPEINRATGSAHDCGFLP